MAKVTELRVNGERRRLDAEGDRSLLQVLREDLGLTGAKYGCGEAQCGACTVLLDGQAARSCVTPVSAAASKEVTTIEGLERDGRLHPLQEAMLEADALQCGYCTPGMILSGVSLLNKKPDPTRQDILQSMEGNICRCGTYRRIVAAVGQAAKKMEGSR